MDADGSWIVFTYRISSDTSTVRVRAWRILRRIGALSIQQSAYVVPNTSLVTRKLRQLQEIIEEVGGETHWLDILQFSQETTARLVQRFNEERCEEYNEFIAACDDALNMLELAPEEFETNLKQLQKWFRKLSARDYFHCAAAELARTFLTQVEDQTPVFMEPESSI